MNHLVSMYFDEILLIIFLLFSRRQALEDVLKYPDTSTSTVMNTLHEYLVMPIRDVLSEVYTCI